MLMRRTDLNGIAFENEKEWNGVNHMNRKENGTGLVDRGGE